MVSPDDNDPHGCIVMAMIGVMVLAFIVALGVLAYTIAKAAHGG